MATYKVLQDIEAEDKFVGPLTLKQFILAGIALVAGYLSFIALSHKVWFLMIPLVPIMLAAGFLAFPWGRDQPTEVWLLAKLRFMLKPRRRIWDQSGMQELVTITAPKHIEDQYVSNNLSQTEVKSRLKALANTIDSRGWAVKNVNVNMYAEPGYGASTLPSSDRLLDTSVLGQASGPVTDIQAADDIMDEVHNPTAQHLSQMIQASSQAHRQEAVQQMQDARDNKKPSKLSRLGKKKSDDGAPADYWFMNLPKPTKTPKGYATFGSKTVAPGQTDDGIPDQPAGPLTKEEEALLDSAHRRQDEEPVAYGHTPVIEPLDKQKKKAKHTSAHSGHSGSSHTTAHHDKSKAAKPAPAADGKSAANSGQGMTQTPDPAILSLANNDDLSVATLARQANKKQEPEPPKGEVVISLR